MQIKSFHPPRRVLMGPGPSDVSPRVLKAMSRPTLGHLDPVFVNMMDEMKSLLKYAFQTQNELTMPVSAPGSAGMETCFVNPVEPGEKVIICQYGIFGSRMNENVERCGAIPVMAHDDWSRAVDPQKLEDVLKANPDASHVSFVHAETSTGAQSDVKTLVDIAHKYSCLVIVDAITSLGGTPVKVDEWHVDAIYSGSQKCLSCTPGLSPISFSMRALEKIKHRKTKVQIWFMDMNLVMCYWGGNTKRDYHHTALINAMYGLHEALVMLQEEGLENVWARHRKIHLALRTSLEAMGLHFVVPESERLPQLNAINAPEGVDEAAVRAILLSDYNLEIGSGLGAIAGKVWRIGLMGQASDPQNVLLCLSALNDVLNRLKEPIHRGAAVDAANLSLAA